MLVSLEMVCVLVSVVRLLRVVELVCCRRGRRQCFSALLSEKMKFMSVTDVVSQLTQGCRLPSLSCMHAFVVVALITVLWSWWSKLTC